MSPVIVVHNELAEIASQLEKGGPEIALKGAQWTEGEVKRSMAEPKSGRVYAKKGGQVHVSSAPGEAPAVDTGNYANAVFSEQDGQDAVVYTTVEYAVPLEFGSAKMESRPAFIPAAFKAIDVLWDMVSKLGKSLKGRPSNG